MVLKSLLSKPDLDIHEIAKLMNLTLDKAVIRVNSEFSPRRLSKLPREVEPLPIDTRQLSSYRTQIGTMLEYALSTAVDKLLEEEYRDDYRLTFAPAHEYPDFFLRDDTLAMLLKIEMKAVDANSDEQAARFSTPTSLIDPNRDLLLLVGWEWKKLSKNGKVIGEYPYIFASVILPAGEIANERDERLTITGGKTEGENVFVFSKKKGVYVADPGNFGKFWKIIHSKRRNSGKLSETMKEFERFLEKVDEKTPHKRIKRKGN